MKTKLVFIALIIISVFMMNAFAQNKEKNKSKSKEKVKVQITELPSKMNTGETKAFNVKISNKSKKSEFNTDGLTFETSGDFTVTPGSIGTFIMQRGESKDFTFNLTSPSYSGKIKFKITFYNDGKKAGSKTKNIKVSDGVIKNKDKDNDGKENEGTRDEDKNKNKDKDKDKDKNKDKNKNKGNEKESENESESEDN